MQKFKVSRMGPHGGSEQKMTIEAETDTEAALIYANRVTEAIPDIILTVRPAEQLAKASAFRVHHSVRFIQEKIVGAEPAGSTSTQAPATPTGRMILMAMTRLA